MDAEVIQLRPTDRRGQRGPLRKLRAERYDMRPEQVEALAEVAYEAVRAYRRVTAGRPLPAWEIAEIERREAIRRQVRDWLMGRRVQQEALLQMQLEDMRAWRLFGAVCAAVTAVA